MSTQYYQEYSTRPACGHHFHLLARGSTNPKMRKQADQLGILPATINKALSALRGTLRAAWQMGQMDAESYHRAVSVDNVKGETLPAGRDLSEGEIRALMACCSEDMRPAWFRDAALIAVLCLGLRRAEVVALDVDNYDPETGALKLTGKGRKERLDRRGEKAKKKAARMLHVPYQARLK